MSVVLCVYLNKSNIHTFLIQKSCSSSDYEVCCRKTIPLSSLFIADKERNRIVTGLDLTDLDILFPNSVVLSDPIDYMRIPIIPGIICELYFIE